MITKRFLIAAALAGTLPTATAGAAFAQSPSQPLVGISTVTTYSVDATITAIDPANRTVTFTGPAGRSVVHKVGEGVRLDTTKVGDLVSVGFEDRLTFVLAGPSARTPGDRDVNVAAAARGPRAAVGVDANQAVLTWWVTAVDTANNKISLVNPGGGEVRTFSVTTPEGRSQLPRVKPGDQLTAVNTQVLIVAITPKKM